MIQGPQGNPQYALQDKGVIDSGYSWHMTGNMSYLSDFQELNGGYVAFRGNPKGGKISDFKLPDENQVLLGVPRENNMYNVNLKNIVPSGDLTCLFAKATIDESNLWHRRLGHVNFKTINKLVKGNLVRGLPTKFLKIKIPVTPQQNGIAERKNRTLNEATRTMLADSLLPILFWAEAVNTSCYVQNKVLVTKPQKKTPYELLHGRTPSIGFMRPFGCPVTILNTLDPLGKFKGKVDEGFLVGYSVNSKAFRVFNSQTHIVQETLHVIFLENKPNVTGTGPSWLFDIDSLTRTMNYQPVTVGNQSNFSAGDATFDSKEHDAEKPESVVNLSPSSSALSGEQDDMTKNKDKGKSPVDYFIGNRDFNAVFDDFSKDSSNDVSTASPIAPTVGQNYFNNTNSISIAGPIVPVAGHNYSNSTNPISAAGPSYSHSSPTHGQSSLRDTYLPPDMVEREDIVYSDHENVGAEADFNNLETSITVKQKEDGIFINQDKYVAEILKKFRSMTGSLMYLTSSRPDIMFAVCACTRFQVTPKVLHLHAVKRIFKYLKGKPNLGLWYPKDSPFDLVAYSDRDYAGVNLDRKSTTGGCQFLGSGLISWQCKKQTVIATSSTKAEYVAGASCCAQVLWIQNQMLDYGLQALVDKKRVVVTEAAIRDALHLDAEGVDCLPNEEIFTELARMGYEKPTTGSALSTHFKLEGYSNGV
nr:uncharacterized mitochondrial protein AtMg00810-like [Tanacetum cinerariifolium]